MGSPGRSTDLSGLLFLSRAESHRLIHRSMHSFLSGGTGTTISLVYCFCVLQTSKEERSMEPRQLRLPGFTRLWASESRRVGLRQLEPLRAIGQGIFVPVRAVEQQDALLLGDQPPQQGLPPCR